MSIADTVTKQYLQDNEVFSDVFNYQLFDGEQVIHPEDLTELDPSEMLVLSGRSTRGKQSKPGTRNLFRDLMKNTVIRRDQHAVYRLNLGTELQTNVHYAMPVRIQMYDAIDYYDQVEQTAKRHRRENNPPASSSGEFLSGFRKEDKLTPVFTLTIYFGSDPWDGPLCLHDMMELRDPRMKQHIQNYRLNLIEPSTLSKDELQKFQTSFREVMGYIKYSKNADELLAFTKDNPRMLLEVSAARVIGTMTGTNISYEEAKEGRIDMCKAIEDLMRTSGEQGHTEGRREGRIEGHIEGKRDGRNEERAKILASLVQLVKEGRMRAEDVAETLEVPLEEVLAAAGAREAKMPE